MGNSGKSGGAKAKKKSWTKVKVKEIPKILCITRALLCEKFKVSGSVARALIKDFADKGLVIPVGQQHRSFSLYKGKEAKTATEKAQAEAAEAEKSKKTGKQDKAAE